MAKIKNTWKHNTFGDGYEQEITLDNGEQYTVRNTMVHNTFGNGYEKEIVKKKSSSDTSWIEVLLPIVGALILFGIGWLYLQLL